MVFSSKTLLSQIFYTKVLKVPFPILAFCRTRGSQPTTCWPSTSGSTACSWSWCLVSSSSSSPGCWSAFILYFTCIPLDLHLDTIYVVANQQSIWPWIILAGRLCHLPPHYISLPLCQQYIAERTIFHSCPERMMNGVWLIIWLLVIYISKEFLKDSWKLKILHISTKYTQVIVPKIGIFWLQCHMIWMINTIMIKITTLFDRSFGWLMTIMFPLINSKSENFKVGLFAKSPLSCGVGNKSSLNLMVFQMLVL